MNTVCLPFLEAPSEALKYKKPETQSITVMSDSKPAKKLTYVTETFNQH